MPARKRLRCNGRLLRTKTGIQKKLHLETSGRVESNGLVGHSNGVARLIQLEALPELFGHRRLARRKRQLESRSSDANRIGKSADARVGGGERIERRRVAIARERSGTLGETN